MLNLNTPLILVGKNFVYLTTNKGLVEINNIKDLVSKIKSDKINLVVAHDLAYYQILEFDKSEIITRSKIENKLQKLIPSDLSKLTWNQQKVSDEKNVYQTLVLENSLLNPFLDSLTQNKIAINDISYFPYLISQTLPKVKKPQLLIFIQGKIKFLAVIWEKNIISTDLGDLENFKDDISSLIEYSKKDYDLEVKNIIAISDRDLTNLKLKIKKIDFNLNKIKFIPLISLHKTTSTDKEKETKAETEIKEDVSPNTPSEAYQELSKDNKSLEKPKSKLALLLVILGISLVIMSIIVFPKLSQKKSVNQPSETIQETSDSIMSPSPNLPSPSPTFYPNLYSIKILNGSTRSGLAGEIRGELELNGFIDVAIGNADRNDYLATQIITENDPELIQFITNIIQDEYEIDKTNTTSGLEEGFDAIIILGNN